MDGVVENYVMSAWRAQGSAGRDQERAMSFGSFFSSPSARVTIPPWISSAPSECPRLKRADFHLIQSLKYSAGKHSMFLTSHDIVKLTGYNRPSAQIRWLLRRNGWRLTALTMHSGARLCTDQMRRLRPVANLKAAHGLFQRTIRFRHALMLS
jgi:hypothetical protein